MFPNIRPAIVQKTVTRITYTMVFFVPMSPLTTITLGKDSTGSGCACLSSGTSKLSILDSRGHSGKFPLEKLLFCLNLQCLKLDAMHRRRRVRLCAYALMHPVETTG